MVSRVQKIRLGIFIVFTFVLMITSLVIVAGKTFMEKRDHYFIKYKGVSVNGLQVGGQVKYYGIIIGRVDEINIDKDDVNNVIVKISVKDGTPLKIDVAAALIPVGITGLKSIEITGGTNEAGFLSPESFIDAGESLFDNITGKAEVIAEKVELLLNNLTEITDVQNRSKINNIIEKIDTLINLLHDPFMNSVANIDSISNKLLILTESGNHTIKKFNTILDSQKIDNILTNTEQFTKELSNLDISNTLSKLDEAIKRADDAFKHIDLTLLQGRDDVLETIENLNETIEHLNDFSRQISEDPSLLIRSKK